MRIVLTHVFCWPFVRRGTERNMDGLARFLTSRGHDVVTVSTRPGSGTIESDERGRRVLHRQYWAPWMRQFRIEPVHPFLVTSLLSIQSARADAVHCFSFTDAFAANLARRWRKHRVILQLNGAPIPGAYYRVPPDRYIIRDAIQGADHLVACSRFVRDLVNQHYGVEPDVLFPPFDPTAFPLGRGPADGRPTILAVGDFNVPRKGVRALVRAFSLLKERVSDVRLRLSGAMSPVLEAQLRSDLPDHVNRAIEVLGLGRPEDVPGQYADASVVVLPSMWEPSGGVLMEAWAAGAPVVATNHGGLPEFVVPEVGILFDPRSNGEQTSNAAGLAEALVSGLGLASSSGIRERCRAHAEQYSWPRLGPAFETLYGAGRP
jgi:glycosyltransferase involved in cell wall biosynthesis